MEKPLLFWDAGLKNQIFIQFTIEFYLKMTP